MKFEDIKDLMKKPEPKADTYEAGMAQNQLLKIGTHAIKIHNMLDNDAEMESWVAKKIDLASNYVKSVHGYTAGSKAGTYDDGGMTEDNGKNSVIYSITPGSEKEKGMMQAEIDQGGKVTNILAATPQDLANQLIKLGVTHDDYYFGHTSDVDFPEEDDGWNNEKYVNDAHGFIQDTHEILKNYKGESVSEDAGEGHMSKSQLYATAKMAIELIDMINKGDDLEGWVQTKLNLAADYLQAVYHYEDYQKLNPYREELDSALMQKHAGVIQKSLDGILARETEIADVDTKPGMMRILKKRVNEVEKDIAKENRKNTDEGGMPASVIKSKQKYANMSDEELADRFKGADEKTLRQMAWRHGYGNMSSHYLDRVKNVMTGKKTATTEAEINEDPRAVGRALANLKYGKEMADAILKGKDTITLVPKAQSYISSVDQTIELLDKMYPTANRKESQETTESELEEGIKDWAKNLAMAGIIVAGMAGVNSINNAIDNSVPAIQAMNSALEMAQDQNDDDLAQLIKKDLSDAKLRLDTGKDLSHVKDLQDKYAKFMKTEGLAYESKLAVQLKQRLK
jgi:hypothetical protein